MLKKINQVPEAWNMLEATMLQQTTIGRDMLEKNVHYPIDSLLDYLNGLQAMSKAARERGEKENVFQREIEAVNFILNRKMYY